jgi:hypothetical protein
MGLRRSSKSSGLSLMGRSEEPVRNAVRQPIDMLNASAFFARHS